ncbi:hypothetical protein GCM10027176_30250 [Actinoallomurus bryophytorum]|uniref:IS3 family transposase n=1 Tax=Actinoallomurus bryophytorum TaxID=1490222 RepID=UPI0011513112
MKTDLIHHRAWPTRHELETEVFSYIEGFYNRYQHSALNYLSPIQYEQSRQEQQTLHEIRRTPGGGCFKTSRGRVPPRYGNSVRR